jgi:hypothetical protein
MLTSGSSHGVLGFRALRDSASGASLPRRKLLGVLDTLTFFDLEKGACEALLSEADFEEIAVEVTRTYPTE